MTPLKSPLVGGGHVSGVSSILSHLPFEGGIAIFIDRGAKFLSKALLLAVIISASLTIKDDSPLAGQS